MEKSIFLTILAKEVLDLRYQLVWASTALFMYGKLTSTEWMGFVISACSVKLINEFGSMVKDAKTAAKEDK